MAPENHLERAQYKIFLKLLVYNGSPFCSAFSQFALFPHHFNLKIHHNLDLEKIAKECFGIEHIWSLGRYLKFSLLLSLF